jgi:hypothetical protein
MLCTEIKAVSTSQYLAISIGQLQESPTNPRKTFSDEGFANIKEEHCWISAHSIPTSYQHVRLAKSSRLGIRHGHDVGTGVCRSCRRRSDLGVRR